MLIHRYVIPYSMIAAGALAYFMLITWSYPADAATFRIGTKTYTINDQSVARIRAFAEEAYKCLPPTTDDPCPPNPAPLDSMYDAIMQGIKDNVRRFEAEQAVKQIPVPGEVD